MDGFRDLYERYYPDVFRFALFLTGDVARAEDLTADTFVRAWTARDRIRQETVRAYLLTITRNLFRDHLRAAQPHVALDERLRDGSPMAESGSNAPRHFSRCAPACATSRAAIDAHCCSTSFAKCRIRKSPLPLGSALAR